jgi:hypothetical protein
VDISTNGIVDVLLIFFTGVELAKVKHSEGSVASNAKLLSNLLRHMHAAKDRDFAGVVVLAELQDVILVRHNSYAPAVRVLGLGENWDWPSAQTRWIRTRWPLDECWTRSMESF